jgi:hypothetical protein
MNKRYQVFLSSTYSDLKIARNYVTQAIMELDCIPAGMEAFPAADEEQMDFIKKIIDDCDYYVLLVGARYGSVDSTGLSYTEREYQYAVERGLPVLAFIHSSPETLPFQNTDGADVAKIARLGSFRERVMNGRIVKMWKDEKELPGLVALALSRAIKTCPAIGWIRADTAAEVDVLSEINELRKENSDLKAELARVLGSSNEIPDLAPISTEIKVSGTHKIYSNHRHLELTWQIETTFEFIFGQIAPDLEKCPSDEEANHLIASHLCAELRKSGNQARVRHNDFNTIKIQLEALGLISVTRAQTTNGGYGVFWFLTSKGRKEMIQIRTIKTET